MNDYTAHMVPRCFGRYLIDLPDDLQPDTMAGATFAIYPYSEFSGALRVKIKPMPHSVFESTLAERKAKLAVEHVPGHQEWPVLGENVSLSDSDGLILNWTNGLTRSTRRLELHGWKDGYAIEMTIDALDESFPENRDDPPELKSGADVPQKLAMLQSLYARTRGRAPDEVPNGPGTCIQNGFISGTASENMREDIAVNFVSRTMPDMTLHIATDSGIGADNTLMDRVPDLERAASASHSRFLQKGTESTSSGLAFQQVLMATPTPNDLPSNLFFKLEANSRHGDTRAPLIDMTLKRVIVKLDPEGKPINMEETLAKRKPDTPALSESESVAMWHAITASLRKRSGAF